MKGYMNIPQTIYVKPCVKCGARPIIENIGRSGYVVRCPDNSHYTTPHGLIDLDNWNRHNKIIPAGDHKVTALPPSSAVMRIFTKNPDITVDE